jgi:hypothetical protein
LPSIVTFVAAGPLADYSTAVTTVTVGNPLGIQAGDVLLAQIVVKDGTGSNVPTAPVGWTYIRQDTATGGNQITSWLYYLIAGANEPASYSWTINSQLAAGVMGAWRGASTVFAPIDNDSGAAVTGPNPLLNSAPSLSPRANGELQVYFYGAQAAQGLTITLSVALTHRIDTASSKEGFTLAIADLAAPSNGMPSPTHTATSSMASSSAFSAQAVLLVPDSIGF